MFDRHTVASLVAGTWLVVSTATAIEPSIVESAKPREVVGTSLKAVVEPRAAESNELRPIAGTSVKFVEPAELPMQDSADDVESAIGEELIPPSSTQRLEPTAADTAADTVPRCKPSCNYCQPNRPLKRHFGRMKTCYWDTVGYPGEYLAIPLGSSVNPAFDAQITNGLAAQMILYRYDFQDPEIDSDPDQLIAHGRRRLSRMAMAVATAPVPLVIESSGDACLDQARRKNVLATLQSMVPVPVPSESVIVATPTVRGLDGEEALIIDDNLMLQTRTRGMSSLPSIPGRILSPVAPAQQPQIQSSSQ